MYVTVHKGAAYLKKKKNSVACLMLVGGKILTLYPVTWAIV